MAGRKAVCGIRVSGVYRLTARGHEALMGSLLEQELGDEDPDRVRWNEVMSLVDERRDLAGLLDAVATDPDLVEIGRNSRAGAMAVLEGAADRGLIEAVAGGPREESRGYDPERVAAALTPETQSSESAAPTPASPSDSRITFVCTRKDCGKVIRVPVELAGRKGRCPRCKRAVRVPSDELAIYGFNPINLRVREDVEPGHYAMWWQEDPQVPEAFTTSTTYAAFDRVNRAMDGFESYQYGNLLLDLGLIDERAPRYALPEEEQYFPVVAPDGVQLLISVSEEKGIRLHCPTDRMSCAYRDRLALEFARYYEKLAQIFQGLPCDGEDERSKHWWRFLSRGVAEQERRGNGMRVVGSLIND